MQFLKGTQSVGGAFFVPLVWVIIPVRLHRALQTSKPFRCCFVFGPLGWRHNMESSCRYRDNTATFYTTVVPVERATTCNSCKICRHTISKLRRRNTRFIETMHVSSQCILLHRSNQIAHASGSPTTLKRCAQRLLAKPICIPCM